jgi:hypothetical protein
MTPRVSLVGLLGASMLGWLAALILFSQSILADPSARHDAPTSTHMRLVET